MRTQALRHGQGVVADAVHAQRDGLDALQDEEGVRFDSKQKSIMQRWPESTAKGAEFVMPTAM